MMTLPVLAGVDCPCSLSQPLSHSFLFFGYVSFAFWVDSTIIVECAKFVSNKRNGLGIIVIQIFGMDIEFIYVKVMLRMGFIVLIYHAYRFQISFAENIWR